MKTLKVADMMKTIESRAAIRMLRREQILTKIAAWLVKKNATVKEVCKKVDKNYNGSLDVEEFKMMLEHMKIQYTAMFLKQLFFSICDSESKNGILSAEELEKALEDYSPQKPKKEVNFVVPKGEALIRAKKDLYTAFKKAMDKEKVNIK